MRCPLVSCKLQIFKGSAGVPPVLAGILPASLERRVASHCLVISLPSTSANRLEAGHGPRDISMGASGALRMPIRTRPPSDPLFPPASSEIGEPGFTARGSRGTSFGFRISLPRRASARALFAPAAEQRDAGEAGYRKEARRRAGLRD